ncbi:hypothetical protein [uncultured Alsobacter sp.]|uniref:hypothetical protein n=1 Tax=uncultured Alsobacter sp. TaxID=1748258 RepID=UPI0026010863|nr:hypothetical protein [uncultured Alsobacter sp.]
MDAAFYGWIEIVLVFGLALAFSAWQLLDLRRLRREREKQERERENREGGP